MNKLISIIALLAFILFLTGCDEGVEQRTLSCTDGNESLNVVYQEDRIMSIASAIDGESINRQDNYEEILSLEETLIETYGSNNTTIFEVMENFVLYFEEEADGNILCDTVVDNVKYKEDAEAENNQSIFGINMAKDSVLADALAIENASKLYCSQTICESDQELTWTQLSPYIEGLDEDDYDFTNNTGIITTKTSSGWTVDIEADGTGAWEIIQNSVPSSCDRDCIIEDID